MRSSLDNVKNHVDWKTISRFSLGSGELCFRGCDRMFGELDHRMISPQSLPQRFADSLARVVPNEKIISQQRHGSDCGVSQVRLCRRPDNESSRDRLIEPPVRARWALRNSSEAHGELAELRIDIGDGAINDHYVAGVGRGTA
ncbi:hypothetical protein NKH57_31585 [Mesorhizobium sp. M1050]|uniref:hypothetical protein n=1 Tax=Mesorhizobium sp. M1050 TaxID=2957051 RepID=UPI003337C0E7